LHHIMAPLYKSQRFALHHQAPTLKQYKITSAKQIMSSPRPHHVKSQCKINIQGARKVLSNSKTELANSVASFCFANGTNLICYILKVPFHSQFFVNTQAVPISHAGVFTHWSHTHNFIRCVHFLVSHWIQHLVQHSASLGIILGASVCTTQVQQKNTSHHV
jgi:hypothetical protein